MPAISTGIRAGTELKFDVLCKHSYLIRIFDLKKDWLFKRRGRRVATNISPVADYHPRGTSNELLEAWIEVYAFCIVSHQKT